MDARIELERPLVVRVMVSCLYLFFIDYIRELNPKVPGRYIAFLCVRYVLSAGERR